MRATLIRWPLALTGVLLLTLAAPARSGQDSLEALVAEYLAAGGRGRGMGEDPIAERFEERRRSRLDSLDGWSGRLAALEWDALDREQQIDHIVLSKLLLQERHRIEGTSERRALLATVIGAPVNGFLLPEGEKSADPVGRRLDGWLSSIERSPVSPAATLRLDLVDPALRFLDQAGDRIERWASSLPADAPDLSDWEKRSQRATKILEARRRALAVLRPQLAERDRWGRPVGAREMEFRIRHQHLIERSLSDLVVMGQNHLRRIQREMESVARSLVPGATADEVWETLSRDHPSAEHLPEVAQKEMESALALILDQDLMTIVEPHRHAETVVTTGRTNQTYPFGGYGGTRRDGDRWVGRYLVSPPTDQMSPEERGERLRGNNLYWTRVVAVHEIWPGHHLQGLVAREKASPLRRRYHSTVMSEGWGLYSEQLMYEQGHFDRKTRMAQLKMQAWRAARVVIDIRLQTGEMGFGDAVSYLVREVGLTRENSEAEVRRYLGNPTRPLSYFVGFLQLMELREAVQAAEGDAFDLKRFHDRVLSYGTIPVVLIRHGLVGAGDLRRL